MQSIFGSPDVDGGLVGGASLVAADFVEYQGTEIARHSGSHHSQEIFF